MLKESGTALRCQLAGRSLTRPRLIRCNEGVLPAARGQQPKSQGGIAHRHTSRAAKAYPTPDTRRCSKCEVIKSVDEFDWKDPKKDAWRSWCRECWKTYQRERWLSVEKSKRLGTLLRFVVCEEDHLESDCITCHLPIEVGQEVVPMT